MEHVIVGLLAAIFGALAHWFFPALTEWNRTRKTTHDLWGEWTSEYQGINEPPGTWIVEKVDISIRKLSSYLILKRKESTFSYNYTGWGSPVKGSHIVGHWESIRQGAHSHGAFMLTVAAQGDMIYGYWVGTDSAGARRYGRWVLAREPQKIPAAKELLDKMVQLA